MRHRRDRPNPLAAAVAIQRPCDLVLGGEVIDEIHRKLDRKLLRIEAKLCAGICVEVHQDAESRRGHDRSILRRPHHAVLLLAGHVPDNAHGGCQVGELLEPVFVAPPQRLQDPSGTRWGESSSETVSMRPLNNCGLRSSHWSVFDRRAFGLFQSGKVPAKFTKRSKGHDLVVVGRVQTGQDRFQTGFDPGMNSLSLPAPAAWVAMASNGSAGAVVGLLVGRRCDRAAWATAIDVQASSASMNQRIRGMQTLCSQFFAVANNRPAEAGPTSSTRHSLQFSIHSLGRDLLNRMKDADVRPMGCQRVDRRRKAKSWHAENCRKVPRSAVVADEHRGGGDFVQQFQ